VLKKSISIENTKTRKQINRTLQVSLFGQFDDESFKKGIKEMPLVDNECYMLGRKEFNILHQKSKFVI